MLPSDDQFRERLTGYGKMPPPQAWQRVERNVGRSNRRRIFLFGLAALIILIGIIALYLQRTKPNAEQPAFENTLPAIDATPVSPKENTLQDINTTPPAHPQQPSKEQEQQNKPQSQQPKYTRIPLADQSIRNEPQDHPVHVTTAFIAESDSLSLDIETPQIADVFANAQSTTSEDHASTDLPNTTIGASGLHLTYSSSEVNSRFQRNPSTETLAQNQAAGYVADKILDVAFSLQLDQVNYTDIREFKNNLLALPFKRKKD